MNKELNICKESNTYDSEFQVSFQFKNQEYYCKAYVRYEYDGAYLTDHEFTFDGEDYDYQFNDITKHELIKAIDDYFCFEWSSEYQDKYHEDMYYDHQQRMEDAEINGY